METERHPDLIFSPLCGDDAASGPRFEAFYRIYAASIPVREQKPRAQLAAMVKSPSYRILLAEEERADGALSTLGLSVIFAPPNEGFCLLEYLAVDGACRGRSVGAQLFVRSAERALSGRSGVPVILEVDSEGPPDSEQELRLRRQRFYQRLGCRRILDCPYVLPLPGEGAPPPMDLWVYFREPQEPIRRDALAGWLRAIYQRVYQCSPDDERIPEILRPVPDPVRIL
jgi:ribosomal protein S18 acetylase RimI-like enzyme